MYLYRGENTMILFCLARNNKSRDFGKGSFLFRLVGIYFARVVLNAVSFYGLEFVHLSWKLTLSKVLLAIFCLKNSKGMLLHVAKTLFCCVLKLRVKCVWNSLDSVIYCCDAKFVIIKF